MLFDNLATQNIIRRDSQLPGLALLLNPERLTAVLTSALGQELTVTALTYLRYKPQTSCLTGYQLTLTTNDKTVPIYARAYHQRDPDKFKKAVSRLPEMSLLGPGGVVLEHERTIIYGFPCDRELRRLSKLFSTTKRREAFLRRLLPAYAELWQAAVIPLRYKAERRFVGRLDIAGRPQALLKSYTGAEFGRALTAAKHTESAAFRTAPILGYSQRARTLVSGWLEGRPLNRVWQDSNSTLAMQMTGAALNAFHQQRTAPFARSRLSNFIAALLELAQDLSFYLPQLKARINHLVVGLTQALLDMAPRVTPIHGDFSSDQVIVQNGAVAFVDFDETCLGHPAQDLGTFLAQLRRAALFGTLSRGIADSLSSAFLDGYTCSLKETNLFLAIALLRLAPHCFRQQMVDWPQKTVLLLDEAERTLAQYQCSQRGQLLSS